MAVLAQNVERVKRLFVKTVELLADHKWDETIKTNQVYPYTVKSWVIRGLTLNWGIQLNF